jgi:hypothetical protein
MSRHKYRDLGASVSVELDAGIGTRRCEGRRIYQGCKLLSDSSFIYIDRERRDFGKDSQEKFGEFFCKSTSRVENILIVSPVFCGRRCGIASASRTNMAEEIVKYLLSNWRSHSVKPGIDRGQRPISVNRSWHSTWLRKHCYSTISVQNSRKRIRVNINECNC